MMVGNSRKQIKVILVGCISAAVACLYSAQASSQNLPNALFRSTIEDVDPGIDHGNSYRNLPETYQPQAVFYRSQEPPGTIIVETSERHLYLIQNETRALRYGIGVGREGFTWQGLLKITHKAEWPDWHPPPEMIVRQPYQPRFMAGVIRWVLVQCTLELRSTAFTARMRRRPLATLFHLAASAWLMTT